MRLYICMCMWSMNDGGVCLLCVPSPFFSHRQAHLLAHCMHHPPTEHTYNKHDIVLSGKRFTDPGREEIDDGAQQVMVTVCAPRTAYNTRLPVVACATHEANGCRKNQKEKQKTKKTSDVSLLMNAANRLMLDSLNKGPLPKDEHARAGTLARHLLHKIWDMAIDDAPPHCIEQPWDLVLRGRTLELHAGVDALIRCVGGGPVEDPWGNDRGIHHYCLLADEVACPVRPAIGNKGGPRHSYEPE